MANFFVVTNLSAYVPKEPAAEFASAKLLEYEDSANKFIGQNIMMGEVLKIEAANVAEAQKAASAFVGTTATTPVVVTEAQWKTS